MAALILLSHLGLQRLIGIVSLGLGIFAVVTLFLGLNLRVAAVTDRDDFIGYAVALRARLFACIVAMALAVGGMALAGATSAELLAVSLLVSARIPDQISDAATGFYLRDGRQSRLSGSFLVRGIATLGVVALAWVWGWSVLALGAGMLVAATIATIGYDLLPERGRHAGGPRHSIIALIRSTWRISPYPALDLLHVNSLRFALVRRPTPLFTASSHSHRPLHTVSDP